MTEREVALLLYPPPRLEARAVWVSPEASRRVGLAFACAEPPVLGDRRDRFNRRRTDKEGR